MSGVNEILVNRLVARAMKNAAWDMLITSGKRGDLGIVRQLLICASDLSCRSPHDIEYLESRIEIPASMLARWEENSS